MVAPAALWQTRAVFRERLSLTDQGCLDQLAQAPSTTSTPTVTPIPLPAVLKPTVGPGPHLVSTGQEEGKAQHSFRPLTGEQCTVHLLSTHSGG